MTDLTFFGSDQYSELVYASLLRAGHSLNRYPDLPPHPSLGILASYGQILPQSTLDLFPQGILCLHPSLLPQYRGATPVPTALAMGDSVTGVTLFKLTAKIDQGEILAQAKEEISPSDTSPDLLTRLFSKGADLLTSWLAGRPIRRLTDSPISRNLIFTRRFTRQSGFVEWPVVQTLLADRTPDPSATANPLLRLRLTHRPTGPILHDLIRALTPWPGVWTIADTKKGNLRISLTPYMQRNTKYMIHISGKPRPISWQDLYRYYLDL